MSNFLMEKSAVLDTRSAYSGWTCKGLTHEGFGSTPSPPFRLDLTAWALRRLPINAVDRWDGNTYQRVLVVDDCLVEVSVTRTGLPTSLELHVSVSSRLAKGHVSGLIAILEKMLGHGAIALGSFSTSSRGKRLAQVRVTCYSSAP